MDRTDGQKEPCPPGTESESAYSSQLPEGSGVHTLAAEPCQPVLEGSQEAALTPATAVAASIGEEQPWEQLQSSSRGFI